MANKYPCQSLCITILAPSAIPTAFCCVYRLYICCSVRVLLHLQAVDLLSSGPPASAAVSTARKQQRSIRDFFTSPPVLPSAKRLKTQPPAQHASAVSNSAQHARADQNASCAGRDAAGAGHDSASSVSAAHDSASAALGGHDAAVSASLAHDSAATASAFQGLLRHESAAEYSGEQRPAEQHTGRQGSVRQTRYFQAGSTSAQTVLVDTQQSPVLQRDPMAQAQDCLTELRSQPWRQAGATIPLGEQSHQLHHSQGALPNQQGQPAFVAASGAAGQQGKIVCFSPAGSDGDKENMCHAVAAGPDTT